MGDFENGQFETAGTTRGEADEWTWETSTSFGGVCPFNSESGLEAYLFGVEEFEYGHALTWDYSYANAFLRLAATGFVASDFGKIARQEDDKSLWHLISNSPATWGRLTTGYNCDSLFTLEDLLLTKSSFA